MEQYTNSTQTSQDNQGTTLSNRNPLSCTCGEKAEQKLIPSSRLLCIRMPKGQANVQAPIFICDRCNSELYPSRYFMGATRVYANLIRQEVLRKLVLDVPGINSTRQEHSEYKNWEILFEGACNVI